uniref:Putative cytidylyltransferase n=1 Tax=viral metagenome TaxID=1070528 RepID=A0A6M3KUC7_9ZZZZ
MTRATAFIPARAGSKGLPGKNKKDFAGKPLVQWSIDQAKASKLFDKIIVSSDDPDIIALADKCGVIPHERHPELATDESIVDEVIFDFFVRPENKCKYICQLNPTSPLRTPEDIVTMYKFIKMKKYFSVVSVKWSDFIGWVGQASNKGPICSYNIDKRPNRQTRKDYFLENGAIYWVKYDVLIAYGNMIGNPERVKLYEMPLERSLEIDTPFDFYIAEKAYEYTSMGLTN